MVSLPITVAVGIAVGVAVIIAFALYFMPKTTQPSNINEIFSGADCTDSPCLVSMITNCEVPKKAVIQSTGSRWVVQTTDINDDICKFAAISYLEDVSGNWSPNARYDCQPKLSELAESRLENFEDLKRNLITNLSWECHVSAP